eukprot:scaffold6052_cov118-Cylindrotheca_fusiformis.AAC.14
MRVLSNDFKSPRRHSTMSPVINGSPVFSPPQSGNTSAPKWKAELKLRNRLSAPPLHMVEAARTVTLSEGSNNLGDDDVNPEEKVLREEYNPLFENMAEIEYNPHEDDYAAQAFGRTSNLEVQMEHQSSGLPAAPEPMLRQMEKRTSGYDFDALLADM